MRGIAILLVILYHNFNFIEYFNYGWLGVDLFFVLSGFLITDILLTTVNTKNYFRNFYARRVLRIFPLYYLSLLLFLVILPLFKNFPLDMSYYQHNQVWFWTYLQNWTLVFWQESSTSVLGHFWSLAVEEQYYLLWPLIILLIKKPRAILVLCITMLVVVITSRYIIWTHKDVVLPYERLFLFTRIDGILIGSMLAALNKINVSLLRKYFTLLLVFLTAGNYLFYFIKRGQDPGFPAWAIAGFTTFSVIFAMLTYEATLQQNKLINLILGNRFLRTLGRYSYGFYIFHWPVFLMIKPYTDQIAGSISGENSIPYMIISATLATTAGFLVSLASYYLFEKHFLNLKKYFSR